MVNNVVSVVFPCLTVDLEQNISVDLDPIFAVRFHIISAAFRFHMLSAGWLFFSRLTYLKLLQW